MIKILIIVVAVIVAVIVIVLLAVCLTGCEKDSYSAVGLVTSNSNTAGTAHMSFISLSGTKNFRMKYDRDRQARLTYSGKLGSGRATVTYKCDGEENVLFTVQAGEDIASSLPLNAAVNGGTFVITVKTDGKCENGDFGFNVVYDR